MKKLLLTLYLIFCWFNIVYAISTVDELIKYCKESPEKISEWISNNIKYKDDMVVWDKEDYYQSPSETLNLKTGDCEDYAILAYACLKKLGYKPRLLVMTTVTEAHCICIFVYKKKWHYIGEEFLTKTNSIFSWGVKYSYNNIEKTKYIFHYFLNEEDINLE